MACYERVTGGGTDEAASAPAELAVFGESKVTFGEIRSRPAMLT
jgi:hypothetical protein